MSYVNFKVHYVMPSVSLHLTFTYLPVHQPQQSVEHTVTGVETEEF